MKVSELNRGTYLKKRIEAIEKELHQIKEAEDSLTGIVVAGRTTAGANVGVAINVEEDEKQLAKELCDKIRNHRFSLLKKYQEELDNL